MRCYFLFPALILLLSGCGGGTDSPSARYIPPPKPGGRLCAVQCRSAFDACAEACNLEQRGCMNDMQRQAIQDYEAYAQQQFKAHADIELRPSDFERPEQCEPVRCMSSCRPMYKKCFEDCGGKIVEDEGGPRLPFEEKK